MIKPRGLLIAATAFLLMGCGNNDMGLNVKPEIQNVTDNFQFQATDMAVETETLDYRWQNTGTLANVNQASSLFAGTATLEIMDASGTRVYHRDLTDNGTFVTQTGVAGRWTIRLILDRAGGTVNFRVQKRP